MSKKELLKWVNKFRLWCVLHPGENECRYCRLDGFENAEWVKYV